MFYLYLDGALHSGPYDHHDAAADNIKELRGPERSSFWEIARSNGDRHGSPAPSQVLKRVASLRTTQGFRRVTIA